MRVALVVLLALLLGCPPALNNPGGVSDDDDASGDDDDASGDDDDASGDDDDDATVEPPPGIPIGFECTDDAECISGLCWDFADYDPWCGGAVCSDRCEDDGICIEYAAMAGASSPEDALCGFDGLCNFVSAGLGSFWCADGVQ